MYKEGQIVRAVQIVKWYGTKNNTGPEEFKEFQEGTLFRVEPENSVTGLGGTTHSGVSPLTDPSFKIPLSPSLDSLKFRREIKSLT
jgi:hypothetical protein